MRAEITTERLRLRPLDLADAPRIASLCGDLEVARWLARVPHPYPLAAAIAFVTEVQAGGGAEVRAIDRRGRPGVLIGVIGIDGLPGDPSLGYWIGREEWGRGLATEAAGAMVAQAFSALGVDLLRSGAFAGNAASLRVQEKLGFRVTGERLLDCAALGEPRRHLDTSLAREDWERAA